jgi:hypothetical protein
MKRLASLVILIASGCGTTSRQCAENTQAPPTDAPTALYGVWLPRIDCWAEETANDVVGFVFLVSCEQAGAGSVEAIMARAPIAAAFRSAREAALVSAEVSAQRKLAVEWWRADFEGTKWIIVPAAPPTTDKMRFVDLPVRGSDSPIGEPDAGLSTNSAVWVLPPPLQDRGIAVAQSRPHANSLLSTRPRDMSFSIFTSWEDLEARTKGRYVGDLYAFVGTKPMRMDWSDRASLRSRPTGDAVISPP